MSHRNAALVPRARLRLARLIVDEGWPIVRAAERYDVSWPTAKRWADRYRELGAAAMNDRSHNPASPSASKRATHRCAHWRETPIALATCATGMPSCRTRCTSRQRPWNVSRALR